MRLALNAFNLCKIDSKFNAKFVISALSSKLNMKNLRQILTQDYVTLALNALNLCKIKAKIQRLICKIYAKIQSKIM